MVLKIKRGVVYTIEFEDKDNEIKESDKLDTDKTQAEKNFYAEKMKNITEGRIYTLVKDLCQQFCRGGEYTINIWNEKDFNEAEQQEHANFQTEYESKYAKYGKLENNPDLFVAPNFSWPEPKNISLHGSTFNSLDNGKEFEHFMFFERVDPSKFSKEVKNNPKAIANYVKQFARYLNKLLEDCKFVHFLISSEKNIETLGKIIGSDFVLKGDAKNPYLFKESHLLDVGTSLVQGYRSYYCSGNETQETHRKKKKLQSFIVNYLNKTFAISSGALHVLLFDNGFYEIFAATEDMNKIIIDAIKKTDFHYDRYGFSRDPIDALNELLRKCAESDSSNNKEDCFYNKMNDEGGEKIKDALADKCAEIFANTKESVKITLNTFIMDYIGGSFVAKFVQSYLSVGEQKNSETGKKLIDALKNWLDNKELLLFRSSYELTYLDTHSMFELFLFDDGLKKSFSNACSRAIKHFMLKDYEQDLMCRQKELEIIKTKSKSLLDKFGVILDDYDFSEYPYRTHGKNIAWLSFYIFLDLVCIIGTIILCNIQLLVVAKIILFIII